MARPSMQPVDKLFAVSKKSMIFRTEMVVFATSHHGGAVRYKPKVVSFSIFAAPGFPLPSGVTS